MYIDEHKIDKEPESAGGAVLYVHEPWLIDRSMYEQEAEPDEADDNVRIYVPLDLSKAALLRRVDSVIAHYGEANEDNESDFGADIGLIISQVEIYDKIWAEKHMLPAGKHSSEAVETVREIIGRLEEIPDGCAECFPFELIDELKGEYL